MPQTKKKEKDLRFLRTDKALIDSISSLLAEKDFDAISIGDICVRASVSRTAFYQHYEDKYALVYAWIVRNIKPPSELFTDDTLEEYLTLLLDAQEACREQVLHLVCPYGNKELQWRISTMWYDGFLEYYQKKQKRGAWFDAPYEMMALYNCSGIVNLLSWNILNEFCFPKEALVRYIVRKIRQSDDLIHF